MPVIADVPQVAQVGGHAGAAGSAYRSAMPDSVRALLGRVRCLVYEINFEVEGVDIWTWRTGSSW